MTHNFFSDRVHKQRKQLSSCTNYSNGTITTVLTDKLGICKYFQHQATINFHCSWRRIQKNIIKFCICILHIGLQYCILQCENIDRCKCLHHVTFCTPRRLRKDFTSFVLHFHAAFLGRWCRQSQLSETGCGGRLDSRQRGARCCGAAYVTMCRQNGTGQQHCT